MSIARLRSDRTLAVAFVLALLAGAAPSRAGPAGTRVIIAQGFVGGAAVALTAAKQFGLFEKYGIAAEIETMNSTQAIQSLIAGKVQVMFGAPAQGLSANAAGERVRAIATLAPNMPYLLLARKPITLVSQLRGKRLSVSAPGLSADRTAILLALKRLGLNPRTEATILVTGTQPMRVQALGSGAIDGTVLESVYRGAAERAGAVVLADLSRLGVPWDQDVVLIVEDYGRANRTIVEGVLKALLEANARILDPRNRTAALPIVATAVGLDDPGDVAVAYELERRLYVTRKPYPTTAAPRAIVDELRGEFPDLARVDVSAFVDASFVRALDVSGFIDRLAGHQYYYVTFFLG